ncbi:expressed unknown protein [Seminavis robusta]|uniref:Uncharacterized protein n=1 Tax=Seminavis robusta TaxID=568900 RepID=A0A9N8HP76_9STRA|nr:expressed unknown protein [Seminavis robusta]|eukprot:Sro879_g214920.1 n/a (417) ;mRNA; r:37224-38474
MEIALSRVTSISNVVLLWALSLPCATWRCIDAFQHVPVIRHIHASSNDAARRQLQHVVPMMISGGEGIPRRHVLQAPLLLLGTGQVATGTEKANALELDLMGESDKGERLTVPLAWIPKLSAYVVYYSIGGEKFGAVVDTGSPFLVVPNYCNRRAYGCFKEADSRPSGLASTWERFDNNEGEVEWRKARFSFINATTDSSMMGPPEMVFGVLSESLMDGSGGVFFGLIRDTDNWIRPSFLGQTNVRALEINLQDNKSLTLYTRSPIRDDNSPQADYIPLVRDLNRKYGDPVIHYTAKALAIQANGNSILKPNDRTPIYVIFDTGVTGMVLSQELFDERYAMARASREKSLWGTVNVSFLTKEGHTVSLEAQKPVTTPLANKPWPKFKNAHLIVLGLAFLDGHTMTIDMDNQKLQIL